MAVDISKLKKGDPKKVEKMKLEFDEFKLDFKKNEKLQKANASTIS